MVSEFGSSPKREPTPTLPLSSIPQKRSLEEGRHSPIVPSPLNPEVKPSDSLAPEDASQAARSKSVRTKKDTLKKRESKGADSARATPDPKPKTTKQQKKQNESSPFRYKLAPPKLSDFDPPRGPVMTTHHEITAPDGQTVEFFETSDQ
jgi:COMPASS component BRE2